MYGPRPVARGARNASTARANDLPAPGTRARPARSPGDERQDRRGTSARAGGRRPTSRVRQTSASPSSTSQRSNASQETTRLRPTAYACLRRPCASAASTGRALDLRTDAGTRALHARPSSTTPKRSPPKGASRRGNRPGNAGALAPGDGARPGAPRQPRRRRAARPRSGRVHPANRLTTGCRVTPSATSPRSSKPPAASRKLSPPCGEALALYEEKEIVPSPAAPANDSPRSSPTA